jgi:hypothetical protein
MGMRTPEQHARTETKDFSLEGACILCGGGLQVRITPEGARTVCLACRWISRPHMTRTEEGIEVTHPAGLVA